MTLEQIMADDSLGPNGGILYALEELEHNQDWLKEGLKGLGEDYVLFDCPGQVELFTHHASLRNIFFRIQKQGYRVRSFGIRMTFAYDPQLLVVHLTDSHVITLPSLYISAILLSLRTMLQFDLPHVNVLTKIDNLSKYPDIAFNLDFYTEVQDLSYLVPQLAQESPLFAGGKFESLNRAVIDLVEDFGLVSFEPLAVEDKKSMMSLLRVLDRAVGYAFGGAEGANDSIWQVAVREGIGTMDIRDVQERWLDAKDEWDEQERQEERETAEGVETLSVGQSNDPNKNQHPSKTERDGSSSNETNFGRR